MTTLTKVLVVIFGLILVFFFSIGFLPFAFTGTSEGQKFEQVIAGVLSPDQLQVIEQRSISTYSGIHGDGEDFMFVLLKPKKAQELIEAVAAVKDTKSVDRLPDPLTPPKWWRPWDARDLRTFRCQNSLSWWHIAVSPSTGRVYLYLFRT